LLSWAIENIIKNGIDAVKDKTADINVAISKIESEIQIDISDNGSGIPRRDWKNIFRPGFSTKKYGWGLGLSLANRIIKDIHRGKLYVKESSVGEGSTISLILR
jgi:C4-dicarboxylate-specific signal transduction histidine kinase